MSDPRGPSRKVTAVARDDKTAAVTLTLDCGHVHKPAPHFAYRVGMAYHCFTCLQVLR